MTARPPIPFIDLKAQQARIAGELRRRLDGVLAHCQFILGPEVAELEAELARFCGARHCVAVSSGTDAIQIAFMAEGIGRGDAVFLPAFTYTAVRHQCSSMSIRAPSRSIRYIWRIASQRFGGKGGCGHAR